MPEPAPNRPPIPTRRALRLLRGGALKETHGLIPWSSNYTFLMGIADDELSALVIYKPREGERPLWDFPTGSLCQREQAAFLVSEALGWGIVPPTVLRDGPHGFGVVQLFIPHDPEQNYFTLARTHQAQFRRIALFDHIVNNADRKGGHCLLDEKGQIWAIDHGICFHAEPKLRTVIWDFQGQSIPPALLEDVQQLRGKLGGDLHEALCELLTPAEVEALGNRIDALLESGVFPQPGPGPNYPWPPV